MIRRLTLLVPILVGAACSDVGVGPGGPPGTLPPAASTCVIEGESPVSGGVRKDQIPALSNPTFVDLESTEFGYLDDSDRVLGLRWGGEWVAIPLNVLRFHEIVNLNGMGDNLAVTYCPLTGTGIAFERSAVKGAEFGVSGLLWRNNLVMYDRAGDESLWVQMRGRSDCGTSEGTVLTALPISDMTWEAWKWLHPQTLVVSENTGHDIAYTANPYSDYERADAPPLFFVERDERRPFKERVLGIPGGNGSATAIPFGVLAGDERAVLDLVVPAGGGADGFSVVVFWDRLGQTAEAFYSAPDWKGGGVAPGTETRFQVENGRFVDELTGSEWRIDGLAVSGPAAGSRLVEVDGSMIAFWFAWAAMNPGTELVTDLP